MWLSLKESRTQLLNATNLDRKFGIRGSKTMGEALRPLLMSAGKSSKAVLFDVKCIGGPGTTKPPSYSRRFIL
jgi:hypothetical protein